MYCRLAAKDPPRLIRKPFQKKDISFIITPKVYISKYQASPNNKHL